MRVLVTGGAGFIGANLVRVLLETGVASSVRVLDDLSTGSSSNLEGIDRVELVVGSVTDPAQVVAAVSGSDAVVHLAARPSVPRSLQDPVATHDVNATGTLHVLEAVRGGTYTVIASSSSVYGADPQLPKSEAGACLPLSPYAASKLAAEGYALAYAASFGVPVLACRFFNVFGPYQRADHAYAAVIPAFVQAALRGDPVPVHGDGLQTRDFTYVGSVCAVLAEAVRQRISSPSPVNLAFGSRRTLLDVIAAIERILGREIDRRHVPVRPGDVRHSQADQRRLRSLFPEIRPVPFRTGLEATVAWMSSAVPLRA